MSKQSKVLKDNWVVNKTKIEPSAVHCQADFKEMIRPFKERNEEILS